MPQRLKQRQEKIQNKRKQTPRKSFIKEVVSWVPLTFHKNNNQIARYPQSQRITAPIPVGIFMKNIDEQTKYGKNYTLEKDFFIQLSELFATVELPALSNFNSENAEYGDAIGNSKNAYLSYSLLETENILYSYNVKYSKNVYNSVYVWDGCDTIYHTYGAIKSYKVFFSRNIVNSNSIYFSNNLTGCSECIWCHDLKNQQFCIKNKQYSKEEYFVLKEKIIRNKTYFSFAHTPQGETNLTINSEKVTNNYFTYNVHQGNNIIFGGSDKSYENLYDVFNAGGGLAGNNIYGGVSNGGGENLYINVLLGWGSNMYYNYYTMGCNHCLGCVGLQNKSYCILNKQYTKEERYDKVDEIFTQMEKDGTLGKFFPGSMNPFYFNDTAAYLIDDSFTKEEVEAAGYLRRDEKIKVDIPEGAEIISSYSTSTQNKPPLDPLLTVGAEANKVPPCEGGHPAESREGGKNNRESIDHYQGRKVNGKFYPISEIGNKVPKVESGAERWIDPEILKKVIQDKEGNYYKIVKMEYDFLMKHGLPLPKLHWLDRIKLGFTFT